MPKRKEKWTKAEDSKLAAALRETAGNLSKVQEKYFPKRSYSSVYHRVSLLGRNSPRRKNIPIRR
jgi:hypothetical protein